MTILFGLPGVRVQKVVRAADGARVVHVVTDDETAAACPVCGVLSTSVRQRRVTRPRDVPYGEEPLAVRWHKVQYACEETACARRAFTEQITEVPAGARVTGRLRRHVADRIGDGLAVSVAGQGLLGWPAAHSAFVDAVVAQLADAEPVKTLGIDETRRGKPRWTRAEDGEGWVKLETFETNFVDLGGSQGLLGQASGRTKANVVAWLDERGQAWKDAVRVVAMDPCATYRAAVAEALPHALIVADHFHLVRLANQAVTDVRRRVTWDLHGRRGRATDPAWAARRRLLRGRERLRPEQFAKMWNDLVDADPSSRILTAWIAKEELRALLAGARTGGQRHEISARLHRFNAWCADSRLPELERLAGTIEAWWPEVLGFLQTGITNAGTEATNRTVKTAARTAYGFRNLDNQRRRVRFACTRRNRRVAVC
jgi:transposase